MMKVFGLPGTGRGTKCVLTCDHFLFLNMCRAVRFSSLQGGVVTNFEDCKELKTKKSNFSIEFTLPCLPLIDG